MNQETLKKILDWISANHEHHNGSDRTEMQLGTGEVTVHKNEYICFDGDKPYVNSLDLEEFIKSL